VVKPSGPMWMGSNGVSFWVKKDVDGIVGAIKSLLQRLWEGDAILVEEFLPTLGPHDFKHGSDVSLFLYYPFCSLSLYYLF
jgi:hypothetical protein